MSPITFVLLSAASGPPDELQAAASRMAVGKQELFLSVAEIGRPNRLPTTRRAMGCPSTIVDELRPDCRASTLRTVIQPAEDCARPVATVGRPNRLPRRSTTGCVMGCIQLSSTNCDQTVERLAACAKMSPISATLKKSSCLPTAIREAAACNSSGGPLAALRSTKVIGDKV